MESGARNRSDLTRMLRERARNVSTWNRKCTTYDMRVQVIDVYNKEKGSFHIEVPSDSTLATIR